MSAFLGPVHHWMYSKIQVLEFLTDQIISFSQQQNWATDFAEKFPHAHREEADAPLEDIIDTANIHGWLSQRTLAAEERFAAVIQALLMQDREQRLGELSELFERLGKERALPRATTPEAAYQAIDGILLDGMPCDGGRWVASQDSDGILWEYDPAMHLLTSTPEGAEAFGALRSAFLRGLLSDSGVRLEPLGATTYRFVKED